MSKLPWLFILKVWNNGFRDNPDAYPQATNIDN